MGVRKPICPITIRGVEYADDDAVAEAFGIGRKAVRNALNKGRADFIGIPAHITRPKVKPVLMKVRVAGRDFDSVEQAARALKVREGTIRAAISKGREEYVGLGRKRAHRAYHFKSPVINPIPMKIGSREWQSQRRAARDLGVCYRRLLKAVAANDQEWLTARLMDLLAREEGRKGKMPRTLDQDHKDSMSEWGRARWERRRVKEAAA